MNWIDAERLIYELALKNTERTNRAIVRVYLTVQKEIEDELKRFFLTIDPNASKQYQAARLAEIFKTINQRLTALTGITADKIEQAFLGQYQDIFNTYAYNFGEYYAAATLTGNMLPFSMVSESVIKAALNEKIGEYSFRKSMQTKQTILRQQLREAVATSITKGESTAKLTERLMEAFNSGISRYTATARTEMLKAYSLSQEASYAQAEELGIKLSAPMWLGSNDGRERAAHVALNNTYARLEKDGKYYFHGSGCKGTGPRLFTGPKSAGMNIQCRCRALRMPFSVDESKRMPSIETEGQAAGTGMPDFAKLLETM